MAKRGASHRHRRIGSPFAGAGRADRMGAGGRQFRCRRLRAADATVGAGARVRVYPSSRRRTVPAPDASSRTARAGRHHDAAERGTIPSGQGRRRSGDCRSPAGTRDKHEHGKSMPKRISFSPTTPLPTARVALRWNILKRVAILPRRPRCFFVIGYACYRLRRVDLAGPCFAPRRRKRPDRAFRLDG